jgi:hypothetical protein
MPVRLTPYGSLLISYDEESNTWVSISGLSFCILPHPVDIEPGVTLGHVFDLVGRNEEIKRFLAEYCSCNIDELHAKARDIVKTKIVRIVEQHPDGTYQVIGETAADALLIAPFFWVYTDKVGDRRLDGGYELLAQSFQFPDGRSGFHRDELDQYFGHLCKLELRLNSFMHIAECDDDKVPEGRTDDLNILEAHIRYTLFDVLTTVYEWFGNPVFDPRNQRQVDEDEEIDSREDGIDENGTNASES